MVAAGDAWEIEPNEWWYLFEVNLLGVFLCCGAAIAGCSNAAGGHIVNLASGPRTCRAPRAPPQRQQGRRALFSETLAEQLRARMPVFSFSPGPSGRP